MADSLQVRGPADGELFGWSVDVNEQFMVVSAWEPDSVYVYQSYSPYDMVAKLPVGGRVRVWSLVISEDNTIAVSYEKYPDHWLTIYNFDGSASWHIADKFDLLTEGLLGVYGEIIVVGMHNVFVGEYYGVTQVYNKIDGKWTQGQMIKMV